MFPPSFRDLSLVFGLLPLFTREITADPGQHNRARREARIRDLREMGRFMNETRLEAERRQDDELRAKLDGESGPFNFGSRLTISGERIAGPSQRRSNRFAQPTSRTAVRPRPSTRLSDSATLKETTNMVVHTEHPAKIHGQGQ